MQPSIRKVFLPLAMLFATAEAVPAQEPVSAEDRRAEYRAVLETYLRGWQTRNVEYFEEVLAPD
ncbi:MAG TPA: hypothetical protein VMN39_00505, partial [Longimicrobiaceae bacterium]|nr:hypothetical protein [Longimicrobiaceae bacterium]